MAFNVGSRTCEETECIKSVKEQRKKAKRVHARFTQYKDDIDGRIMSAKSRSKKRGFGFDLTREFVGTTINSPCVYCSAVGSSQLDRKDNSIGYLMSNVVPACKRCNTVKSMYLTYDEMLKVADALGWKVNN